MNQYISSVVTCDASVEINITSDMVENCSLKLIINDKYAPMPKHHFCKVYGGHGGKAQYIPILATVFTQLL